jgi:hypothetical protein
MRGEEEIMALLVGTIMKRLIVNHLNHSRDTTQHKAAVCMMAYQLIETWATVFLRLVAMVFRVLSNGFSPGKICLKRTPRGPVGRRAASV